MKMWGGGGGSVRRKVGMGKAASTSSRIVVISVLLLLICVDSSSAGLWSWLWGGGKVLLRDIDQVTLKGGSLTDGGAPQLRCVGGTARCKYKPDVVECFNQGTSGDDNVDWKCEAPQMGPDYAFGSGVVICEGSADTPVAKGSHYVVKGSCSLVYTIHLSFRGMWRLATSEYYEGPWTTWDIILAACHLLPFMIVLFLLYEVLCKQCQLYWRDSSSSSCSAATYDDDGISPQERRHRRRSLKKRTIFTSNVDGERRDLEALADDFRDCNYEEKTYCSLSLPALDFEQRKSNVSTSGSTRRNANANNGEVISEDKEAAAAAAAESAFTQIVRKSVKIQQQQQQEVQDQIQSEDGALLLGDGDDWAKIANENLSRNNNNCNADATYNVEGREWFMDLNGETSWSEFGMDSIAPTSSGGTINSKATTATAAVAAASSQKLITQTQGQDQSQSQDGTLLQDGDNWEGEMGEPAENADAGKAFDDIIRHYLSLE